MYDRERAEYFIYEIYIDGVDLLFASARLGVRARHASRDRTCTRTLIGHAHKASAHMHAPHAHQGRNHKLLQNRFVWLSLSYNDCRYYNLWRFDSPPAASPQKCIVVYLSRAHLVINAYVRAPRERKIAMGEEKPCVVKRMTE